MKNNEKKSGSSLWLKFFSLLCLIMLIYVAYSVSKVLYRKGQVQKEIDDLQREAARIEKNNNELRDKVAYFESKDFQEKEVKDKLSLQGPDENLVIVKSGPAKEKQSEPQIKIEEKKITDSRTIYRKWWDYFFKY